MKKDYIKGLYKLGYPDEEQYIVFFKNNTCQIMKHKLQIKNKILRMSISKLLGMTESVL